MFANFMYKLGPPSDARLYAVGVTPAVKLEGPEDPPEAKILSWVFKLVHCVD